MLEVPLTGTSLCALIDDCDAWVLRHRWYLDATGYARGGRSDVRLHRAVLGLTPGDGLVVDHWSGDKLDNRRSNLRVVTQAANCQNVVTSKGEMRGVYFNRERRKFYGQVKHAGKRHSTGYVGSAEEAQALVRELRRRILPHSRL